MKKFPQFWEGRRQISKIATLYYYRISYNFFNKKIEAQKNKNTQELK